LRRAADHRYAFAGVYLPPLQAVFDTTALPVQDLLIAVGAAVGILVEAWKWGYSGRGEATLPWA
jgi:hypothetical protein